jgi:hypothetical protein
MNIDHWRVCRSDVLLFSVSGVSLMLFLPLGLIFGG